MSVLHTSVRPSRQNHNRQSMRLQMQPTMTTADWLRRAADAWSEADATTDPQVRHAKVLIAEGCERLAKHASFLAEGDAYPSVSWFGEMVRSMNNMHPSIGLRIRRLRIAMARKLRARRGHVTADAR
jgi:hypothetical protein